MPCFRPVLALTLLLTALIGNSSAADKPNVLLICIDDLKPLLGCYGEEIIQTPNIDGLAARGMRFTAAYCNQAVCAPSRNALLTGLRPQTLGIYDLGTNFRKSRPDAVTLPQYFMNHGYRVEGLGKIFHVGHGNHEDPQSWSVPHWTPKTRQYQLPENRPKRRREGAKGTAYESANVPDTAYADGKIAEEAVHRIKSFAAKSEEAFFLAVGFSKPHLPFCAPQKYWGLYDPNAFAIPERQSAPEHAPKFAPTNSAELHGYRGIPKQRALPDELARSLIHGYHAATSYMDAQVGRVLAALDGAGMADNTIIVLWGDHGWHLGDHGMWCKHTNYEQATRIPLIFAVSGVTKPGSTSAALVESVDIFPTFCHLAGLPIPAGLDGADFTGTLKDPTSSAKEAIFHVYPRDNRLGSAVRTSRYRLVEWRSWQADSPIEFELYDYESDPEETSNLARQRPEVVQQLQAILATQAAARPPITSVPVESDVSPKR
jgi:iduronate 2-sulfatase